MSVRKIGNGSAVEHRYRYEMTDADHEALAALLHSLRGMVIISSYPGELYHRLYGDWKRVEWTGGQFCSQIAGERKRTECVWMNEAAWKASPRGLF